MQINEEDFIQITYWHNEPGRHRFGEALFMPSMVKDIGTAAIGVSDAPAREDHVHGLPTTIPTYTPQLDQGASTNIAKTIETAVYTVYGRVCFVMVGLSITAAGTSGSDITVTLPVTPAYQYVTAISGAYHRVSGVQYVFAAEIVPTLQAKVRFLGGTTNPYLGSGVTFAVANGDTLRFGGFYFV